VFVVGELMRHSFLIRRRRVLDQEIQEPTLLGLTLPAVGFAALLAVCIVAMLVLPAFGHIGWTAGAVAVILTWRLWRLLRQPRAGAASLTSRQRWLLRLRVLARGAFTVLLSVWLALFVWLAVCPGGPNPPPKADPSLIRVVTWNIHCGQEGGPPWKQFDWPARKHALRSALDVVRPDILCLQEATPDQVAFVEQTLLGHHRVGVGRDDGQSGGEHCAIYFSKERFEVLDNGTFWLEEPIDQPRVGSALDVKRICTWVRLRDRVSGRTLRVYNTHLYLTEAPRRTAAKLILAQIAAGDPTDAVVLTADFNAGPASLSRRLFAQAGLTDSATLAGTPPGQPTFQLYGIGVSCLDGVLVDRRWRVRRHDILAMKPGSTFPSDHFGIVADLAVKPIAL
jgi:endonuclease/exonuclease/phosphatase family metal-dependent hydrolase